MKWWVERRRARDVGFGIALAVVARGAAFGATWTWTGGGTSDLWSEPANWFEGTKPSSHYTTILVFDGITRLTPEQDIDRDFQFNSLVFSNNAGAFQLGGMTNIDGEVGWLNLQFAGATPSPSITVLGTNNILIRGTLIARSSEVNNTITVPAGVTLQVPWIRGGTGERVVKDGPGTLRMVEHADGQRYVAVSSTVGPRYWVKDGTVEIGCLTNRYVCGNTQYTNWVVSTYQNKCSYILQVGDGVGSETSAVVRYVVQHTTSPNYIPVIEPDGLLDLNGVATLDLIGSYNRLTNRSGLVRLSTSRMLCRSGSQIHLLGNARIEGSPDLNNFSLYGGASIFVDDTGTRAKIRGGSRVIGLGYITNNVQDKSSDEVDLEYDSVFGNFTDVSDAVAALRKEGPGTMLLAGAVLQGGAGPTQMVVEGTLLLNTGALVRSRSPTASHLWHVYTNATLGGSGTISNAPVFVYSGTLAPGLTSASRCGILTIWSNLTFEGSCRLLIDVTGGDEVPGVDHDQLMVKRDVMGLANVDLYVTVHGTPDLNGDALTILDAQNSLAGQSFANVFYTGPGSMEVDTSSGDVVLKFKSAPQGTILLLH